MYELWSVNRLDGSVDVAWWGRWPTVCAAQRAAYQIGDGDYVVSDAEGREYAWPRVRSGVAA